jgi:hypothetical protein
MQPVIRIPLDKLEVFESMMNALNIPGKKPNMLLSLMIDLANTPEGGAWLREQMTPKTPEVLSWTTRKPLQIV